MGAMQASYVGVLDTLKLTIGLGPEVTDSAVALAEREKVAQLRVDDFFNQVFAQTARLRPLPGALGQVLRDQEGGKISSPASRWRSKWPRRAALNAPGGPGGPGGPGAGGPQGGPPQGVSPAAGPPPVSAPPSSQP
jgi:hypothetical protein